MHESGRSGDRRIRILFFTTSLGGGGAEMHLLRLVKHLNPQEFEIALAVARPDEREAHVPGHVRVVHLRTGKLNSSTLRLIRALLPLRRLVQEWHPDVVFSVMNLPNIISVVATHLVPKRPKIVLGEQLPPTMLKRYSSNLLVKIMVQLIPRVYARADCIVALSQGVSLDLLNLNHRFSAMLEVIYNAGYDEVVLEGAREAIPGNGVGRTARPLIVACGRLVQQKGFAYLLDALPLVHREIAADLWIVGEGTERPHLERKIQELGLADSVHLLGFQSNPFKYMAAADVFVLSSLYEGFANVVVEAMAVGTPVVATDCPYGPGEIVQDGINGVLVPTADAQALATAIVRVLSDTRLRSYLSEQGRLRAQAFSSLNAVAAHARLFRRLVGVEAT